MPKFKVLVGCNFPPDDTRAEPGDVIDVPEKVGRALVLMDAAEPWSPPEKKPAGDPTPDPDPQPVSEALNADASDEEADDETSNGGD